MASDLMDSGEYWEKVLRCSKGMSLARARRTFSIMGRSEDSVSYTHLTLPTTVDV